jgi:hypothetical protein
MADDDNKTEDVEDETEDTTDEEYEAPDQETWAKTTARVTHLNAEAKKWRLRAQGKDPKWTAPAPAKVEDENDPEEKPATTKRQPKVDVDAVRRETEEAARAKLKPGLVKSAARDALKAAGLILPEKGDGASAYQRAIRLLDMDEIDVDDDGEVSGVDDQVKAVKRDFPELFARRGAKVVNAGAGSNGDGTSQKTETSANRLAAMVTGKG